MGRRRYIESERPGGGEGEIDIGEKGSWRREGYES